MKHSTWPRTWTDNLVQHKQKKKDLRFGTFNVRRRVNGTIVLKRVFKKQEEEGWTQLLWLRIGTSVGRL